MTFNEAEATIASEIQKIANLASNAKPGDVFFQTMNSTNGFCFMGYLISCEERIAEKIRNAMKDAVVVILKEEGLSNGEGDLRIIGGPQANA